MVKDDGLPGREELESTLHRLKAELEDLEETISFNFTHSAAHINGGEVSRDEESVTELKSEIAGLEGMLKRMET